MLKSFYINNFRLFKHLELPKLGRVNLIIGKNGSGKSALLEAVRLYASNAAPEVLKDIIISRQEFWDPDYPEAPMFFNVARYLFGDRAVPTLNQEGIEIGLLNPAETLKFSFTLFKIEKNINGEINKTRMAVSELPEEQNISIELALVIEDENLMYDVIDMVQTFSDGLSPRIHPILKENKYTVQYVPTQNTDIAHIASLWDTTPPDLEDEVISGMQLLYPDILDLKFVENKASDFHTDHRIVLARLKNQGESFPLRSLGDGLYRLLYIVLALVNAKDGILLIDEFENGLHYKIHPQIWDSVFHLAKKFNVQVFATTHSSDCIRGFEVAWREHLGAGTFFRLDVKEDRVKATYYDHETLQDAIIADVEVR